MARQGKFMKKEINRVVKETLQKAKKDFRDCAIRTNNILFIEAENIYDSLIDQFYKYKTSSYVRHWEGVPGTMEGQALKYGKDFSMDNKHKKSPRLLIGFSGAGMEAEGVEYQHHTPDEVLHYVMNGARFVLPATVSEMMMIDPTTIQYHSKYFSFDGGTIQEAFNKFGHEWNSISRNVFYPMWGAYVKRWSK